MKMDVTRLSMEEVDEIAGRLMRLNIQTSFSIMGGRALLVATPAPNAPARIDDAW